MRKRFSWKRFLIVFFSILVIAAAFIFWPQKVDLSYLTNAGEPYDAIILRDTWGVPHIFGVTDADASYGLAYANAEDDFLTIQQTLAAARGTLASIYGINAAANDYMVHLLRIWDDLNENYRSDLSSETRAVLEAYAAGINQYAALHPEEVLSEALFPVQGKDVAAGSVHKSPLFFGLDGDLAELFQEERTKDVSPRPEAQFFQTDALIGSNTFSIGPGRTSDGSTYLAVNSHQPWEGAITWYEAHIHSEEGLDVVGGIFPGSPLILHGHNRNLGWAFTVNHPDLVDIYVLELNPDNPNQYLFDDQWLDLEVRQAPIKVKLMGNLSWTVKQEVLWSVYGPVVRQEHGTYALRYAGMGLVDIWEQIYGLNKASNFEEWRRAMSQGGFASFNVGYADREGNIYYLYNADMPIRTEGYDWNLYLPGDTSETLWTEYLPFDDLPQVLNPTAGFTQNANSSPFQTTLDPDNPDPNDFSSTMGIETRMSNRSLRALELFSSDESITFDEFITYKFDMTYSSKSDVPKLVEILLDNPPPEGENLLEGIEILREWDFEADPESPGATIAILTLYDLAWTSQSFSGSRLVGSDFIVQEVLDSYQRTIESMVENFGRVNVPWGEVNRLIRGNVDLGMGGGPDLLHAVGSSLQEDGRLKGYVGDSYVLLIRWDADGKVQSFSIHQYGSATLDENSRHYADQSPLFVKRQLKPVWFDEADIRAHLEREYRPGEELEP
jgi:acyl-homoserine-lactone acylase